MRQIGRTGQTGKTSRTDEKAEGGFAFSAEGGMLGWVSVVVRLVRKGGSGSARAAFLGSEIVELS
jgi:hypothetical protein